MVLVFNLLLECTFFTFFKKKWISATLSRTWFKPYLKKVFPLWDWCFARRCRVDVTAKFMPLSHWYKKISTALFRVEKNWIGCCLQDIHVHLVPSGSRLVFGKGKVSLSLTLFNKSVFYRSSTFPVKKKRSMDVLTVLFRFNGSMCLFGWKRNL